jgi:hypothetical protein
MKLLTDINEKFLIGDPITDFELDILLKFYEHLEQDLKVLGSHFHFAWREVLDRKIRLEGYKEARERKINA